MAFIFKLTPEGSNSPEVPLFTETFGPQQRQQPREISRHDVQSGTPGAATTGVNPADVEFSGFWVGNEAPDIRDEFETLTADVGTERVDVEAFERDGTSRSDPREGTYRIESAKTERANTDGETGGIRYSISLIEE